MKKTYIIPKMSIDVFDAENIVTEASITNVTLMKEQMEKQGYNVVAVQSILDYYN